ncbi:MAG: hypothetical protein U0234_32705 [Sandaracinus sp.]
MKVSEVEPLLAAIHRGDEDVEASFPMIEALLEGGLLREAPDRSEEATKLAELQARLRAATSEEARRALRSEVLALSEALASHGSGALVAIPSSDAAPYRGSSGGSGKRLVLTARGRAMLADLAQRLERGGAMEVDAFEHHMELLRTTLEARGRKARAIETLLAPQANDPSPATWRSAAIGLSVRSESPEQIARVMREMVTAGGARCAPWTPSQLVVAAEGLCLGARDLAALDPGLAIRMLIDRRDTLGRTGLPPDETLRSSLVLAAMDPASSREALERAKHVAASDLSIPLGAALVCVATESLSSGSLAMRVSAGRGWLDNLTSDTKALTEALVLGLATGADPADVARRIRGHHQELTRFSPTATLPSAALLSWIDAPLDETLDDLRLAASIVRANRLGFETGETTGHAIKLLLLSAILAEGDEGDPEEKLALGLRLSRGVATLETGSIAAIVPILAGAASAYTKLMLDAATLWDDYVRTQRGTYASGGHYHHYG